MGLMGAWYEPVGITWILSYFIFIFLTTGWLILLVYTAVHSWAVNHTVSGWAELVTLELVKLMSSPGVMEKHLLNKKIKAQVGWEAIKTENGEWQLPKTDLFGYSGPNSDEWCTFGGVNHRFCFAPVHPCRSLFITLNGQMNMHVSAL